MLLNLTSPLLLGGALAIVASLALPGAARAADESGAPPVLNYTMKDIDGKDVPLKQFRGDVILIVNVASFCGNTPQYAALEKLYEQYKERGFTILAFPANEFGKQEP